MQAIPAENLENPRMLMQDYAERTGVDPTAQEFDVDAVLFPDLHLYNKQPHPDAVQPSDNAVEGDQAKSEPDAVDGSVEVAALSLEEAGPPEWPALDPIGDDDSDEDDAAAACFGYATIGGESEEEEEEEGDEAQAPGSSDMQGATSGEEDQGGFVPNLRPDMRYSEFEAEVVRAARYGATLSPAEEDATVGEGLDGEWQEAEIVRNEEDTDVARPAPNGGHAASTLAPLSEERAAAVKEAMAGFALPAEATPSWAAGIPEADWIKAIAAGAKGGEAKVPEHMLAALGLHGANLEPAPMFKK